MPEMHAKNDDDNEEDVVILVYYQRLCDALFLLPATTAPWTGVHQAGVTLSGVSPSMICQIYLSAQNMVDHPAPVDEEFIRIISAINCTQL